MTSFSSRLYAKLLNVRGFGVQLLMPPFYHFVFFKDFSVYFYFYFWQIYYFFVNIRFYCIVRIVAYKFLFKNLFFYFFLFVFCFLFSNSSLKYFFAYSPASFLSCRNESISCLVNILEVFNEVFCFSVCKHFVNSSFL